MKTSKKLLALALAGTMVVPTLVGCGDDDDRVINDNSKNWYEDYSTVSTSEYNQDLFYLNEFKFKIADPSVIYVDHGEEKGYFYTYGTSDMVGGYGIQCWRSSDLTNWEYKSVAYKPDFDECWDYKNHWAPEVIFDKDYGDKGAYFMFFNSDNGTLDTGNNNWATKGDNFKNISVVYSENPYGPFVPVFESNKMEPVYDFSANNNKIKDPLLARSNAIDAHPFIDADGNKYLYYSGYGRDGNGGSHGQTIFGLKMNNKDWFSPDYSSLVELTKLHNSTVDRDDNDCDEGSGVASVNEGAFVWQHNGKYYLTFSVYAFTQPMYQVRQAIGDNPLGPFTKIKPRDGGQIILTDSTWDGKITSAGHHCFIKCGDELMIAYHSFYNRQNIDDARAIAIDTVSWVKNSAGIELMHANGPTYSYQPLPEEISGYKNLAPQATVTSSNTADGSDVKYLTDNTIKAMNSDLAKEYETAANKSGMTEITLAFDEPVNASAVMIYNSSDYDHMFMNVSKVELTCPRNGGGTVNRVINNVPFDYDWNVTRYRTMVPGGSSIVEFKEMAVEKIKITMRTKPDEPININEIKVLGRDTDPVVAPDTLGNYTVTPHDPVEAMPKYESKTFGTVKDFYKPDTNPVEGRDYDLKSSYGFDLTHDNDTDRYVDKTWAGNMQEIYFKDFKSTVLYLEVEMSVLDHNNTYNWDPAPKAGIVLRTPNRTFVSYNIDYQSSFAGQQVGFVESNSTGSDYAWSSTYVNYSVPGGISYTGEEFVKLGIARLGSEIYLFANDHFITNCRTGKLNDNDGTATAIGFVSFNCFTRYRNYSLLTDRKAIEDKIVALGGTLA